MAAIARKSRISICFLFPSYSFHKSHVSCLSHYFSTCKTGNIVPSEFLIEKYQFSLETAAKVSSFLKNPQRTDSVLSFLKETGFSNAQLEKITKSNPSLVSSSLLKRIMSKIKCFEDLGFSAIEIAAIVTNNPTILNHSVTNKIVPSVSALKSLLGSNARVAKLLTMPGWGVVTDLNKALLPNVEFLKSCGIAVDQINNFLCISPNVFLLSPEKIRRYVRKVDEMGVERSSKVFIYAVRVLTSMSDASWELKLKTFRDLGFLEDDILRVLRSSPAVLSVSQNKIRKVIEILIETGRYDMSCIIKCPSSLTYSVEKRYKPRLQILKNLEKKGLIFKWPSLGTLSKLTDDKFRMSFVSLNDNEAGKDFVRRTGFSDKIDKYVADSLGE